jgi:hypothetical protein
MQIRRMCYILTLRKEEQTLRQSDIVRGYKLGIKAGLSSRELHHLSKSLAIDEYRVRTGANFE